MLPQKHPSTQTPLSSGVISGEMKKLSEWNDVGGKKIEEGLRAISVFLGYWFIARAIIRLLDKAEPEWWAEVVLSLVYRDWGFGVYVIYRLVPSLLAIAAFCIWRPNANLLRWLAAPIGWVVLVAVS